LDDRELWERVERSLGVLSFSERAVLNLRTGLGDGYRYTIKECARIFKVTDSKIQYREKKALAKLKHVGLELKDTPMPRKESVMIPGSAKKTAVNQNIIIAPVKPAYNEYVRGRYVFWRRCRVNRFHAQTVTVWAEDQDDAFDMVDRCCRICQLEEGK